MHPETMTQIARQRTAEIRNSARFYQVSTGHIQHETPIRHRTGQVLPTTGGYGAGAAAS